MAFHEITLSGEHKEDDNHELDSALLSSEQMINENTESQLPLFDERFNFLNPVMIGEFEGFHVHNNNGGRGGVLDVKEGGGRGIHALDGVCKTAGNQIKPPASKKGCCLKAQKAQKHLSHSQMG